MVRRTVDLNLTGALLVARAAVRALGTSYGGGGGVIVNVSSGAATLGSPGEYVQYAAAKAGVDALTARAGPGGRRRGHPGGRRRPGLVRTRIHEDAGDAGRLERVAARVPLGRAGEPAEVADAIALADERRRRRTSPAPRCGSPAAAERAPDCLATSASDPPGVGRASAGVRGPGGH